MSAALISSTVVRRTPPKFPRGIAAQGYRQISKTRGIKDSACTWGNEQGNYCRDLNLAQSLWHLQRSSCWKAAKKEFNTQLRAWKAGIAPKPVRLGVLRRKGEYTPALWMEHIDGLTLADACDRGYVTYYERYGVIDSLRDELYQIGIDHHDLHHCNVLVAFEKGKRRSKKSVKRFYAIDYEMAHVRKQRRRRR